MQGYGLSRWHPRTHRHQAVQQVAGHSIGNCFHILDGRSFNAAGCCWPQVVAPM